MAQSTDKTGADKQPIIHIKVSKGIKDLLRRLHTESLKSDTSVIVDLIVKEGERRGLTVAD